MARTNDEQGRGEGGPGREATGEETRAAAGGEQNQWARPPSSIWGRGVFGLFKRVRPHEFSSFCHALALLLECGIPLVKALNMMAVRMENRTLARAAANMARAVDEGRTFADAAAQQGKLFSGAILSMLRAGERSGKLGDMLNNIAERGERVSIARRKLLSMLIYPFLVVVAAILVVAVVFGVLAKGFDFFTQMELEIPPAMQCLLSIGAWLRSGQFWTVVVLVVIGAPILYAIAMRVYGLRLCRDRFLLSFPVLRHFVKEDVLANFGRVFSTMLHSGIPVQESLQAAHDTCRNEVARRAIVRAQEAVRGGQRVTPALEQAGIFPPLAYDLCAAGEEAGALDRVFARLSDYYEHQMTVEAEIVGRLIQPAIVLVLALVVGFIVISFFQMYTSVLYQLQVQAASV